MNYIYGTSGALSALAMMAPGRCQSQIERGVAWLVSCQNADGGWGETCQSYEDASLKGQGPSTASQTAWALTGLLDAAFCLSPLPQRDTNDAQKGIHYLLSTQTRGHVGGSTLLPALASRSTFICAIGFTAIIFR